MNKKCSKCKEYKLYSEFYKNNRMKCGVSSRCKGCIAEVRKEYYSKNKLKIKWRNKEFYQSNGEELKRKKREYYQRNKVKFKQKGIIYREENLEKIKDYQKLYWKREDVKERKKDYQQRADVKQKRKNYMKEYGSSRKEEKKEYNKEYGISHKKEISEKKKKYCRMENVKRRRNEYARGKWRNNIKYKLSQSLSTLVQKALKGNKNGRHWEDLVGFTLREFKKHLESRFKKGMTWDNYGRNGWHIDHIVPISLFNYTNSEDVDFKRCWSLSNLQPLWAKENLSKGKKLL